MSENAKAPEVIYAVSHSADLSEGTWTFQPKEAFEVKAGLYAIVPEENYVQLKAQRDKYCQMLGYAIMSVAQYEKAATGIAKQFIAQRDKDVMEAISVMKEIQDKELQKIKAKLYDYQQAIDEIKEFAETKDISVFHHEILMRIAHKAEKGGQSL